MASHALSRNLFSLTSPTSATTICSSAYSRSLPYSSRSIGNLQRPYRPRTFATSTPFNADFTHTIIGAGAVGLAVARQLAAREGTSTLLIERHGTVGTETSSRNSEVSQMPQVNACLDRGALRIRNTEDQNQPYTGNPRRPLLRPRLPQNKALHRRQTNALRPLF